MYLPLVFWVYYYVRRMKVSNRAARCGTPAHHLQSILRIVCNYIRSRYENKLEKQIAYLLARFYIGYDSLDWSKLRSVLVRTHHISRVDIVETGFAGIRTLVTRALAASDMLHSRDMSFICLCGFQIFLKKFRSFCVFWW